MPSVLPHWGWGEVRDNSDRQRETETERFQGTEPWPWDGKLGGTITGLLLAQNRRSVRGAPPRIEAARCRVNGKQMQWWSAPTFYSPP